MKFLFALFLFSSLVCSCRRYNTQQPEQNTAEIERLKNEIFLRVHRELVEEDAEAIENYARQRNWQMKTTESGLWYMIYKNGNGEKATHGKTVTLKYTVSLLDSTICYSSEQTGPKEFQLGRGFVDDIESGLEEGVLLMRAGDKALLIIPPHLAHGLAGDGNCIPQRTVILYDVELVGVK